MNTEDRRSAHDLEHPSRPAWRVLFRTTEGRILLLGITVAVLGLTAMGVVALLSPMAARMIGAMAFFNVIFGRAVSMSIGYAGGYGHILVVPVNIWVESVLVLLFYPLFVFSMRKLVVFPSLKRFLARTRTTAERHHDKVRRYGVVGLFMFVWFPFWMTGPVVGSAIGFLLGFHAWLTVSVVLTGTIIAMVVWAYVMYDLQSRAAVLAPWAPSAIVVLIILFVLAGYCLNRQARAREKSNLKRTQHDTDEHELDQIKTPDTKRQQR